VSKLSIGLIYLIFLELIRLDLLDLKRNDFKLFSKPDLNKNNPALNKNNLTEKGSLTFRLNLKA